MWPVSQILQIVVSSRQRKSPHEKFARQPNWRAEWKWRKREFSEKRGVRREPFRTGEDKTWTRGPSPSPLFGPGPRTTIMDLVHWHFVKFYRKVLHRVHEHSFLNSESWTNTEKKTTTTTTRFDETLSTDAHDWLQIFSCGYMTYTLLAHVQSRDC